MSRPNIAPGVLAEMVEAVPSRLKRKLDKNPTLADTWEWTDGGDWVEVRASEEVLLQVSASGVASADDLTCNCLLAPRCLHRLAVARTLPLASDATAPEAAAPPERDSPRTLERTAIDEDERAAAKASLAALEALLGTGLEGAGIATEGQLLGAVHRCRSAGLHRLSAALLRLVAHVRARGPEVPWKPVMDDLRDALGLACRLVEAPDASLVERGWGRRPYAPLDPVALYGVVATPFSTQVGYSGVTTFVVDRAGQLFSFSHVVPEAGAGLSDKTPLLKGATVRHRDAARHQLLLEGGTRSPDGRLGTGQRVKTVLGSEVDWWTEPVASLFAASMESQLARVFASRQDPPHMRSEGAGLLFVDGVSDGHGRLVVQGIAYPLTARPGGTERERADIRNLGAARGAQVRVVARAGVRPELELIAFASPGHAPWLVGHGGNRDIADVWGPVVDTPPASPPPAQSTAAWQPLERTLLAVVRLGWRAVTASRSAAVQRDAAQLAQRGFRGADELVRHLVASGRPADGASFGRPARSPFATAWRAGAVYLHALDGWAARQSWGSEASDATPSGYSG